MRRKTLARAVTSPAAGPGIKKVLAGFVGSGKAHDWEFQKPSQVMPIQATKKSPVKESKENQSSTQATETEGAESSPGTLGIKVSESIRPDNDWVM